MSGTHELDINLDREVDRNWNVDINLPPLPSLPEAPSAPSNVFLVRRRFMAPTSGSTRSLSFKLPDGFTFSSATPSLQQILCGIEAFDLAFQSGATHELSNFGLTLEWSISEDETVITVNVKFYLDKDTDDDTNIQNGTRISPSAYADVGIIVTGQANAGTYQYGPDGGTFDIPVQSDGMRSTFISCGWRNAASDDEKFCSHTLNPGGASFSSSSDGVEAVVFDPQSNVVWANHAKSANAYGALIAIGDPDTCAFDAKTTPFGEQEPAISFSSDREIYQVFTFINALSNVGKGSTQSNSLSKYTCGGLKASLRDHHKTVELGWKDHNAKWSDGAGGSWDTQVDYTCVAVFAGTSS